MDSLSWWAAALLAVGVAGLGSLWTYLLQRWSEDRRNQREDKLRFLADRRKAYASIITLAVSIQEDLRRAGKVDQIRQQIEDRLAALKKTRGPDGLIQPEEQAEFDELLNTLSTTYDEVIEAARRTILNLADDLSTVTLLASAKVREAADPLLQVALEKDPAKFEQRYGAALESYIAAARADLGVT